MFGIFNSEKSREERIEGCDHEWEEYSDQIIHNYVFDDDDGKPYVVKEMESGKQCAKCPKTEQSEYVEERLYFSVERVEETKSKDF